MNRALKIFGIACALAGVAFAIVYAFRTDPVAMISGKRLSGEEAAYPVSWDFTEAHSTIAVEVRPQQPHSVTTICFVHDGVLFVPARAGGEKKWTGYAVAHSLARLKIGETVYPVALHRIAEDLTALKDSIVAKYPRFEDFDLDKTPDMWLFRVSAREPSG